VTKNLLAIVACGICVRDDLLGMVICGICEICVTQIPSAAGLYEEGADDGRKDRDTELDDGLPGFHVFDE
jgi:hypothetical protein